MKRLDAVRLLGGAVLTGSGGAAAASAQTSPITMATTPVDSAAEPYYGKDAGIFKAAGLDVELQSGALNGSAIAAAVAAGSLDVGVSNIVSIVQAHAKHIPFVIISPGGLYTSRTPSTYLFVPNGSSYKTTSDLNGKTIGVNTLRGLPQYGTQAWLDKNGARSETIKFTEIGPVDMLVALSSGRIDAGAFVEPFATQARSVGRAIGAPFLPNGSTRRKFSPSSISRRGTAAFRPSPLAKSYSRHRRRPVRASSHFFTPPNAFASRRRDGHGHAGLRRRSG